MWKSLKLYWNGKYSTRYLQSVPQHHESKFDWLIFGVYCHFQQYFSYIMATSFSGGRSWSTWREPPNMGKQLVNFITGDCESSAPFFVIYKLIWKCTHVSVFLLHFQVYFCGVLNFLDFNKNINKYIYIYIHHWIFCFSIELCRMCII